MYPVQAMDSSKKEKHDIIAHRDLWKSAMNRISRCGRKAWMDPKNGEIVDKQGPRQHVEGNVQVAIASLKSQHQDLTQRNALELAQTRLKRIKESL